MGISTITFGFIQQSLYLTNCRLDFNGQKMVELGDQTLHLKGYLLKKDYHRFLAKEYFERLGFRHTSIDLHGKSGCYPIDLSLPITDKFWLNRFDVLTNCGTSEHVDNQYECFRNMHNLVKPKGIFISFLACTPYEQDKAGVRSQHCKFYYPTFFMTRLCKSNNYKLIAAELLPLTGCIGYCYQKVDDEEFRPSGKELSSWINEYEVSDNI